MFVDEGSAYITISLQLEPDGTEVELGLTFRIIMQQIC